MKLKCFFTGHKHDHTEYDYNPVCNHCGMHDYYDSIQCDPGYSHAKWYDCYEFNLRHWWYIIEFRFNQWLQNYSRKCCDCGKPERRFGKDVGDHSNCLPF